jgi:hypothetical protein
MDELYKRLNQNQREDYAAWVDEILHRRCAADELEIELVRELIDQQCTWQEIGEVLGVSKQAAHARWSAHCELL